jgi:hypothetical protein
MKKFLYPAIFVIALASAAFTRPVPTQKKDLITVYYVNSMSSCTSYVVQDDNCVPDDLGYVCMEDTPDDGWQVVLQYAFGNTCYQPYYSYFPND